MLRDGKIAYVSFFFSFQMYFFPFLFFLRINIFALRDGKIAYVTFFLVLFLAVCIFEFFLEFFWGSLHVCGCVFVFFFWFDVIWVEFGC